VDVDAILTSYGLAAVFVVMLLKSAGLPFPIPADVIMLATAARAAQGKIPLWQAFVALWLAMVLGGGIQFVLARGPARRFIYRFGGYLGLPPSRLDRASSKLAKAGALGVGIAVLTPGVRAAAVVACGLAGIPTGTFVSGLIAGSTAFLCLHFALAYAGTAILSSVASAVSPWILVPLLALGLGVWIVLRRRQRPKAPLRAVVADSLEAWHEATCPACLALGAVRRLKEVGVE
jgi:membrane protein DedA with SNARE-associated domain